MSRPSLHISEKYVFRIRQLLRAAGYDDTHLVEGIHDLQDYMIESGAFYPEDIASGFIEWRGHGTSPAHHAIAEIVKAGFFNDGGVESYAAPCAPMALGLAEIAAQAGALRPDTRFVLGSADISNLGGLNETLPDRSMTNPMIEHFIQLPREVIDVWAEKHGYHADAFIVRSGGDEFKYVFRMRTLDGTPIDNTLFAHEIHDLTDYIAEVNHHYAHECGVDKIPHYKKNRAPGVVNTLALRPIDPETPDIQQLMVDLGADIAAMRATQTLNASRAEQPFKNDMLSLPSSSPPAHHALPSVNPYHASTLEPRADESLEHLSLRMALEKAGFADLAALTDLFRYDTNRRWSVLDTRHPAYTALDPQTRELVRATIEAEHMRGVIDPVSRNYSVAFFNQCCELADYQGRTNRLKVHLHNLSGMNLLGDMLGDAVLREAGNVIDRAHDTIIANGKPMQKPLVARCGGGEFMVFLGGDINEAQVRNFAKAVRKGIEQLNETVIDDFAKAHRLGGALSKIAQNGYITIGDIPCPKNAAFGANHGLEVEFEGKKHAQIPKTSSWQEFIRTEPPTHELVRR